LPPPAATGHRLHAGDEGLENSGRSILGEWTIGSAPASNGSSATGDPRRQGLSAFDPKKESLRSSTSLGGLAALIKGGGEGQDEEVKLASLPDVDCRGHLQGLCDLIGENRIDEKELKGPEIQAIELDRDEEEKDTVSLLESPQDTPERKMPTEVGLSPLRKLIRAPWDWMKSPWKKKTRTSRTYTKRQGKREREQERKELVRNEHCKEAEGSESVQVPH